MNDYTPTIDNIRRAWAWWRKPMLARRHYFPDEEALFEVTDLELDRWLQQVKAEAWDEGAETAWNMSTPEVNGARYHWRHEGEPENPYRQETES